MKISDQALGAIMMALQKSLAEQTDIVPLLRGMDFQTNQNEELIVLNPPVFQFDQEIIFDNTEEYEDDCRLDENLEVSENEKTKTVGSD